ncbi:MAG: hypothetical protein AAFO69_09810, partial [Bacteroidota bacterium]
SARPINYKVAIPGALSTYFGLVERDLPPIQRGPSIYVPQQNKLMRQVGESKEIIANLDNQLIQQYKLIGKVASAGEQFLNVDNDFDRGDMEELLEKGQKYDSLSQVLEQYQQEANSYALLLPLIRRFDDTYETLFRLDSLADVGVRSLAAIRARPEWEQLVQKLKSELGLLLNDDVEQNWSVKINGKYRELDGINESLEELINSRLVLNEELVSGITSVNVAYRFAQDHLSPARAIRLLNYLQRPTVSVSSKPMYHLKRMDATRLRLAMVNRYSGDTVLTQTLDVPAYRGWDTEFSTGFVFNSLYQRDFFTEEKLIATVEGIDTVTVIREQKVFEGDMAFGAFFHLSRRAAIARYGLSLGLGLSLLDGRPRYMLGGHALFLKDQSLGLTAGLAAANIRQLGSQVSKDGLTPDGPLPEDFGVLPTLDRFRIGWYAAIVWNFARK